MILTRKENIKMLSQVTLGKSGMMRAVFLMCLISAIVGCRRKSSDAKPETGSPANQIDQQAPERSDVPGLEPPHWDRVPTVKALPVIYFDFDAVSIRSDQMKSIDAAVMELREHPETTVMLEGHADERGTTEYNMHLGERRALAVKDYLVRVGGIAAERIQIISKGEEDPEDVGHSEEAWAKNRRVEFYRVK